MMESVCCECGKHLGWKEGENGKKSHGLCSVCLVDLYKDNFPPELLEEMKLKAEKNESVCV